MKYLVTDDSKFARLNLIRSLKKLVGEDAPIYQAANGLEALKIVKNESPEIIFLDLNMPVMDGYEAIPKIKELHPKIKIIVVSADIQEKAQAMVLSLGADIHVQKPINIDKMQELIDI